MSSLTRLHSERALSVVERINEVLKYAGCSIEHEDGHGAFIIDTQNGYEAFRPSYETDKPDPRRAFCDRCRRTFDEDPNEPGQPVLHTCVSDWVAQRLPD